MKFTNLSIKGLCFFIITLILPIQAYAISNSGKVPVLVYHSWDIHPGCTESTNQSLALASDLEVIYQNGYTVVPVYWIAQWATGERDGGTLPEKIVGITFDDGALQDWYDTYPDGCYTKSFYKVLLDFKNAHPELRLLSYSPHASSFVIASPVARKIIGGSTTSDNWWYAAQHSGLMEIYNHSLDHDHTSISGPVLDSDPHFVSKAPFSRGVKVAAGGYYSGIWNGQGNFQSIGNFNAAKAEIVFSGQYIASKIGMYPDLFAYPYGGHTEYLVNTFFPTNRNLHQTYAAFGTDAVYVTRSSNTYKLGRYVRSRDWNDSAGLEQILSPHPGC